MSIHKLYDFGVLFDQHDLPDEEAQGIVKFLDELDAVYKTYAQRAKKISHSGAYTQSGQREQRAALAAEVDKEMTKFSNRADIWSKFAQERERDITAKLNAPPPGNEIVRAIQAMEVRSEIRKLDAAAIPAEYTSAIESGNRLVSDAIEEAQPPLVPRKLIERMRERRAQVLYPKEASALAQARVAAEHVRGGVDSARVALRKLAIPIPVTGDDELPSKPKRSAQLVTAH